MKKHQMKWRNEKRALLRRVKPPGTTVPPAFFYTVMMMMKWGFRAHQQLWLYRANENSILEKQSVYFATLTMYECVFVRPIVHYASMSVNEVNK